MNTGQSSLRHVSPLQADALEARFGLSVAARLSAGADALPHDVSERLRVARQQAVARAAARAMKAASAPAESPAETVVVSGTDAGGAMTLGLGGPEPRSGRRLLPRLGWLGTLLPAALLLIGLLGIEHWREREQIATAADIDMALLGDDLPPSAYTDPGFAEYLMEPTSATLPPLETEARHEESATPEQPAALTPEQRRNRDMME